jgi:hypothetical protein
MSRKVVLWLVWVGFIAYILFLAPPLQADTLTLLKNLLTGQWTKINPVILSLFSLVGIWLQIYSCLMFFDGRMQKIPAWLFLLAAVGSGVIGLIPYLALREPNQSFSGSKDALLKLVDSRWTGVILSLSTIVLLAYGLLAGDWAGFIQQFQTSRFINGMTIAFCIFCLLFSAILGDDMARRGVTNSQTFWAVVLIPLIGPLAYLCLRPPVSESTTKVSTRQQMAWK